MRAYRARRHRVGAVAGRLRLPVRARAECDPPNRRPRRPEPFAPPSASMARSVAAPPPSPLRAIGGPGHQEPFRQEIRRQHPALSPGPTASAPSALSARRRSRSRRRCGDTRAHALWPRRVHRHVHEDGIAGDAGPLDLKPQGVVGFPVPGRGLRQLDGVAHMSLGGAPPLVDLAGRHHFAVQRYLAADEKAPGGMGRQVGLHFNHPARPMGAHAANSHSCSRSHTGPRMPLGAPSGRDGSKTTSS